MISLLKDKTFCEHPYGIRPPADCDKMDKIMEQLYGRLRDSRKMFRFFPNKRLITFSFQVKYVCHEF